MEPHKHLFLAVLAALVLCSWTGATAQPGRDSLRATDVVQLVLRNAPSITQAAEQVEAADARIRLAESAWSPTVSASASYTYLAPGAKIEFGPEVFRLYPASNYDSRVELRQQLYDFGKTSAAADLGRSRLRSAQVGVDLTKIGLAYEALRVFYAILYLRSAVAVQDEQIATLQEHLGATKKRVAAGSATEFDVLTTEVRVASAQNQRIELASTEHKTEIALARLIGSQQEGPLPLAGAFEEGPLERDTDSLVAVAGRQRPEMLAAVDEEQTAQLQLRLADVSDAPSLNVGVSYGFKNGLMPNIDVLRGNLAASVRLDVPITEGGRAGHRREEAEALLRAAQARQEDVKQQVRQEVRQALSDLRSTAEKLSTSELQVKQARDAVAIARKRYAAGAISNLDLLDMETSLEQANLSHLQSLYALTISRIALDRAVGSTP